MNALQLRRMLGESLRYEIDDGILTLTGYFTGERVQLNLRNLDDEMLEKLIVDEEEYDD